ncbi:hypothetical protein [Phragmitibacter flavus]|uniref:hypothetical protein n=1 Tax=Phragmitibacter flavus TaxID=2576071 RepID=UPI0010FE16E1|nr:hypothetical protein [Phragmitibacter flavus]
MKAVERSRMKVNLVAWNAPELKGFPLSVRHRLACEASWRTLRSLDGILSMVAMLFAASIRGGLDGLGVSAWISWPVFIAAVLLTHGFLWNPAYLLHLRNVVQSFKSNKDARQTQADGGGQR